MARRRYHKQTAFLDLLFNILVGTVFLFTMAFLLISVKERDADIQTKAEYVITLTWEEGSADDIDLWVEDPTGRILFFRQRSLGLMHLDRDDLGSPNDTMMLPSGEVIKYPYNQEIVTIRGFVPGEWTVNAHMYHKRDVNPVRATVKIEKLNPSVETVQLKEFRMGTSWQEITVCRFEMTTGGDIISWSELPKDLVNVNNSRTWRDQP